MVPPNSSSKTAGETVACPSCGAQATGKFCSDCGATLSASSCSACSAPLAPGAKFCHRCGTPAGSDAPRETRSFSSGLPWAVAAIALVALIALLAGQRFGRTPDAGPAPAADQAAAPFAGGAAGGRAPDISNLTPSEAAIRLYKRVMGANERGQTDTVQMFAPMAITAYQMLGTLDLDQRYDLGRIGAVSGDQEVARAQADSILAVNPTHLLGLILAEDAARMRKDAAATRTYHDKLLASAAAERAKKLPEYDAHENDITAALGTKRQ